MAIELNSGVPRPRLPRCDDLPAVIAGMPPGADVRTPDGRFGHGNSMSSGRSLRLSVRRMLGRADVTNEMVKAVAEDAHRIYQATLQTLPSDAAPVAQLVALYARHGALGAFYSGRAAELGLESEQAVAFGQLGIQHGQRAERCLVSAVDVATRIAKSTPAPIDMDALNRDAEAETQARRTAGATAASGAVPHDESNAR